VIRFFISINHHTNPSTWSSTYDRTIKTADYITNACSGSTAYTSLQLLLPGGVTVIAGADVNANTKAM
jgi:hypothetical protein